MMNFQLFDDLAASEESSGYHQNAAQLRAVPELIEALRECITEPGAHSLLHARDRMRAQEIRINTISNRARAALAPFQKEIA